CLCVCVRVCMCVCVCVCVCDGVCVSDYLSTINIPWDTRLVYQISCSTPAYCLRMDLATGRERENKREREEQKEKTENTHGKQGANSTFLSSPLLSSPLLSSTLQYLFEIGRAHV